MAKVTSIEQVKPVFSDVRQWYNQNLHPDKNNYDDAEVYKHVYHDGSFAGVFQLTSKGAQRLFKAAKPENIVDIAVLTSIYRPGPLSAKVDKIYLEAKAGKKFEWGHPLFEQVLGDTYNCLIFQESVMDLAEIVGGFPKEQCDNVRRAIMKRDLSKGESAKKEAKALEDEFVKGAVKNGVSEATARKSYEQILWFAGYGFNRAHAVAYAIDSYMCAWLLTHHEEEWLAAYLESMSGSPENKAEALSSIKSLGFTIAPLDINFASSAWTCVPGKKFMPSFLSCKGIGGAAVEEIMAMRPYTNLEGLLWNLDGSWKHSKFNKRALQSLIVIEAFGSMDLVGPGKTFPNYRAMNWVLVDNADQLKKSPKKEPGFGHRRLLELIEESQTMPDWTRSEKVKLYIDLMGDTNVNIVISPEFQEMLQRKGIKPINELEGEDMVWFVVTDSIVKKTKNGKEYLLTTGVGTNGKQHKIFMWSNSVTLDEGKVYIAKMSQSEFGYGTKGAAREIRPS